MIEVMYRITTYGTIRICDLASFEEMTAEDLLADGLTGDTEIDILKDFKVDDEDRIIP